MGKACAATVQLSLCRDDVPGKEAVRKAKKRSGRASAGIMRKEFILYTYICIYVYASSISVNIGHAGIILCS